MIRPLEGRFERGGDVGRSREVLTGALERGGNHPAVRGERGWAAPCRWAMCLGFFESFHFFQIWKEAVGLRGLSRLTCVCIFKAV